MKTRRQIKEQARSSFAAQRGVGILLILLMVVIAGACSGLAFIYVGYLVTVLLVPVVSIGLIWGYLKIYRGEQTDIGVLLSKFNNSYARCLGGYWWMMLFTTLWSMLFAVPGIVKAYSYRMAPFILADCPNVPAKEALKLSMKMTKGHKGALFVNDLSFIGWFILSGLTAMILGVVYVLPYYCATQAGFYTELRDEALRSGIISPSELG